MIRAFPQRKEGKPWRSVREGIGRYLDLYNRRRPHSSLDGMAPDRAYYEHTSMPPIRLAA